MKIGIGLRGVLYLEIEKEGILGNYTTASIIPGSQDAVAKLALDHELLLVAARLTPSDRVWSMSFVDSHFPDKFGAMFFGNDKSLVYLDAMIDDGIHNLKPNVARHRILFGQPWNQNAPAELYRVKSWPEILYYFNGIKK